MPSEQVKAKLVSVIIPIFNNWRLTCDCLESLLKTAHFGLDQHEREVILVDNGSVEIDQDRLTAFKNQLRLVYLRLDQNRGFGPACNFAAKTSAARNLLFLNNDTYVFSGSIPAMEKSLEENPSVGMVGARLLYPDFTIQHAGVVINQHLYCQHVFQGYPAEFSPALKPRNLMAVTGAAIMIGRSLFEKLGGFDEGYLNSYEDIDLCLKVQFDGGKSVLYEPNAVFLHYESMSGNRFSKESDNHKYFVSKWKGRITPDAETFFGRSYSKEVDYLKAKLRETLSKTEYFESKSSMRDPKVTGESDYLAVLRALIESENSVRDLQSRIDELEVKSLVSRNDFNTISASKSYRLGRLLSSPYRLLGHFRKQKA